MYVMLSTLLLAGSALALPATTPNTIRTDTCLDKSSDVAAWQIRDFDYHASYIFTTPAHQNSWGYVNFTLENSAIPWRATCAAASSQLQDFFYGTVNYDCELPEGTDGEASFSFSRPSGELKVNQTWLCEDPVASFIAQGGIVLDLDCSEEEYTNPDWEVGQIYSSRTITCKPVTVDAPITEKSAGL